MGVFSNLFGSSEKQDNSNGKIHWISLQNLGQLNEIINESTTTPVVIFKHSTRCSVSRMALKQFENEFDLGDKVTPYFLDLIEHRDVSNEIATRFKVQHQSPQLIIIKNGVAVYDVSHSDIDALDLQKYL